MEIIFSAIGEFKGNNSIMHLAQCCRCYYFCCFAVIVIPVTDIKSDGFTYGGRLIWKYIKWQLISLNIAIRTQGGDIGKTSHIVSTQYMLATII